MVVRDSGGPPPTGYVEDDEDKAEIFELLETKLDLDTTEAALTELSEADFETFVYGSLDEMHAIRDRSLELRIAHDLLERFFDSL